MSGSLQSDVTQGLAIHLLGGFRVSVGDRRIPETAWRLRKAKSLVKLLAIEPSHRLHREQLMDKLWPELEPEAATNNFHQVLHVARRTLDTAGGNPFRYLHLQDDVINLCPEEPLWVDVESFEVAAGQARRTQDPLAYQKAADIYSGDLLPEDLYEDWAASRREILLQEYLTLLVHLAMLYERQKEFDLAKEAFGHLILSDPTNEVAHRGLMRLHALTGQRQQAIRQFQRLQETLRRDLEMEPESETQNLYDDILADRFPQPGAAEPFAVEPEVVRQPSTRASITEQAPPRPSNIPAQLTNFIGREWEMAQVRQLLAVTRLLTLTGAGGCGKTRLALEVANELIEDYADGVTLVQLASLDDPSLVVQSVASALGIHESADQPLLASVCEHLRSTEMLLILDNCEHLPDACTKLTESLLGTCPKLRILATSRESLRAPGEKVWTVPPLSVPDIRRLPPIERLMTYEAIRLFVDRALLVQPGFVLNAQNGTSVSRICHVLDGIPLAIEMAAGRVNALSVEQIYERLGDSFRLLTEGYRAAPPRHRTLRAAVDWSYDLLSDQERLVFNRLSVFSGGFDLEAAEAVCGESEAESQGVMELLFQLVEKSLVSVEEGLEGAVRYRLLEPLRQYGQERLEGSEEADTTRQRHLSVFLKLAEKAEPELTGANQSVWLDSLDSEHDNLRAALGWTVRSQQVEPELRMAGALWRFWLVRGYFGEGRRWLESALSRSRGASESFRAKALNGAATLAWHQGEYEHATAFFERALDLQRELEDTRGLALTLNNLGAVAFAQGKFERSEELKEEALILLREQGDRRGIAHTLNNLGLLARERRDYDRAKVYLDEGLSIVRELEDKGGIALSLYNLGLVWQYQGEYHKANTILMDSFRLFKELDDKWGVALAQFSIGVVAQHLGDSERAIESLSNSIFLYQDLGDTLGIAECLEGLVGVASTQRSFERAATLLGASEALRIAIGSPLSPASRAELEPYMAASRNGLGPEKFTEASEVGQGMSLERAIEYAAESKSRLD